MLSANHFLKKSRPIILNQLYYHPLICLSLVVIIIVSHVIVVFAERPSKRDDFDFPTHFNFLRVRKKVLWCANDPDVCSDPAKNPWGGTTCCFHRFCKDIMNDPNHCGSCGRVCGFGLVCCVGYCVDTRNDPLHCGACFEVCHGESACSFSMCGYGG